MPRKPKALVLDSWAVLAYLGGEATGQEVADLITTAHENRTPMYMSIINAGEVWYILAREFSEAAADKALADLAGLGIDLIDADWPLTRMAATLKARHRMSYADCFAAALAKDRKSDLVTGDKEFKQVEGEVTVRWL
ncbi:MAG: type II toxin-antitoxin system VapC family toxin [Betaproteobacteria bacterium]|nr:type II toxin-antitoxin system VapC family toxin [Betaproteobacteria bacterium]